MDITRTTIFSLPIKPRIKAGLFSVLLAALVLGRLSCAQAAGTWTPLANQAPEPIGTTLLLTDGTVMAQGTASDKDDGVSAHWFKLTPDAHGSYAGGTWTRLADMHHARLYYASVVLRDGRVLIAGGEYTEAGYVDDNTVEIYNPLANTWTEIAGPGWDHIGDAPIKTLFDGTVLLGSITSVQTGLYDYTTNAWSAGGNKPFGSSEESWALLPDQTVVTAQINNSPFALKYLPSSNSWVSAGQTPAGHDLVQSNEIGPGVLLPNGKCLFVGATGHTALYTMPASAAQPGTWQAGPDFPTDATGNRLEAKDAPGCLLVNGKVLCLVAPHGDGGDYPNGQQFFEYTYDAGGGTLAAAPDAGLFSSETPAFTGRMLALPSGQVLYSNFDSQLVVYTPDSGPNAAWKPTVSGVSANADGSYHVSGTQFNGLSEGAYYGDDASESTNYPLVRLTDGSGIVTYARTFNHSTMGLATGSLPVATNFTLPSSLTPGTYQLQVVANGIASSPISFTLSPTLPPTLVNDTAASVTYTGSWGYSSGRGAGDYQDDVHYSASAGDSVSYTFTGTGVGYVTETNSDEGSVDVYLDGAFQATVSCSTASRQVQQTVWSATGLSSGTHTLRLVNRGGGYMLLDALSLSTDTTPTAPSAPTNLKATAGSASVALTWTASAGATSYSVYRSTASGTETLLVGGLTATSYTDTGLTNGTTYFYQVAALNASGTSARSAEASATPAALTSLVNDTAAGVTYTGSWGYSSGRGAGDYQDDVHYSASAGDSVSYTFTGTGVGYVTETNSDEGSVDVYLDGAFQATVSCSTASRQVQQTVWSATGLSSGTHTLRLVNRGGGYMLLDGISTGK